MSRNRIIYNIQDFYGGPSEAKKNIISHSEQFLQRFERVFSFNYSTNVPRVEVGSLGSQGTLANPNLNGLDVNFDVSYYINGIGNEIRAGLTPLYHLHDYTIVNQTPGQTFSNIFSGLYDRTLNGDRRNYYLVLESGSDDLHKNENVSVAYEPSGNIEDFYSVYASGNSVICFLNSYLTSYRSSASVGEFPTVTMNFTADDVIGFTSGSGVCVPVLDYDDKISHNGLYRFVIPKYSGDVNNNVASVILPGDITVDLNSSNFDNLVIDLSGALIQSYDLNVNIPREGISYLGGYRPINREIIPPISTTLNFNALINETTRGSLLSSLDSKDKYNITLWLKNTKATGAFINVLRYDLKNATLVDMSFNDVLGNNLSVGLTFNAESTPRGFITGLFMSGIISHRANGTLPVFSTALMGEGNWAGHPLLTEDGQEIFIENLEMTPETY